MGGGCLLVNAVWKLEAACLHVAGVPQCRWSSVDAVGAWEGSLWIWKEFGGDRTLQRRRHELRDTLEFPEAGRDKKDPPVE